MGKGGGKGAGKGGAQLGKLMKGKSKENQQDAANAGAVDASQEWKMVEEYERMAKLAETTHQRLKQMQQQEQQNSFTNAKKLRSIHLKLMRLDRVEGLKRDIEVLAQNHERNIDRKNAIVQMLTRDLDDAEEQFQTSQRTHMDKMQILINLHNQKLAKIEQEFERDLKELKSEFKVEKVYIETKHQREVNEMQSVINQVASEQAKRDAAAKQAHETEKEEIRSKKEEVINELKIQLENRIAKLAKKFDEAHTQYLQSTQRDTQSFEGLLTTDDSLSKKIGEKKDAIDRLAINLAYWKKKIETNNRECTLRNNQLRDQKLTILRHCNGLKARMKRFRQDEARKLAELTAMSREAIKSNDDKLVIATRVIQLAELARKYQTEREKVVPFYQSSLSPEQEAELAQLEEKAAKHTESAARRAQLATALDHNDNPVGTWNHLDNFYKKYNKVLLDKLAIEQEKKRLQKENSDLRSILKQYLDGITVNQTAVDDDNPLLIVNGRINLLEKEQQVRMAAMPNNITNANQIVGSYAMQRVPLR